MVLKRILPLLIAVAAIASIVVGGGMALVEYNQMASADQVEGTVLNSSVVDRGVREQTGGSYEARILYRYSVDGETYEDTNVAPRDDPRFTNEANAGDFAAKYPSDADITVYYDPDAPDDSFIEQRYNLTWFGLNAFGWIAIAYLVIFNAYGIRATAVRLVEGVPFLGAKTPLGTVAALPFWVFLWTATFAPLAEYYRRTLEPSQWAILATTLFGVLGFAWFAGQVIGWGKDQLLEE